MFKKLLISCFTLSCVMFFYQGVFAFNDVPYDHDYHEDISYLYNRGIVEGYADNSFHPNHSVPRAEALGMIFKARGEDVGDYQNAGFTDVHSSEWFFPVINYAWTKGMINGHPDGSFHPRDNVNTAEGIKMVIGVFFDEFTPPSYEDDPLIEMSYGDWFADYMLFAKEKGIISKNKYYHPSKVLTRGELASMLHRVLLIKEGESQYISDLDERELNEYRLFIPKLHIIDVPINYVDDFTDYNKALDVLWDGVGNFRYQPGILGKIVIYGHSSYYQTKDFPYKYIFRKINELNPGDKIYINYKNKGYIYEIFQEQIVEPNNLEVLQSYGYEELALFTCWPPDTIKQRYVLNARRVYLEVKED